MDGFACSSWYFLRFADPHNDQKPFDRSKAEYWLPVDDYIGGAEHAVMHLLYARFWTKVMFDEGLINFTEPFTTLRNHGMILAPDGQKMSKSKNNTIEPDGLIETGYGADAVRIMELFIGPWNQAANWSMEGLGGAYRFLNRVWEIVRVYQDSAKADPLSENNKEYDDRPIWLAAHTAIARVSEDLSVMGFNTAIARLMEYVNELYKLRVNHWMFADSGKDAWKFAIENLLKLLAPIAPHVTEELWHELGHKESVHLSDWPVHDGQYLIKDTVIVVVQVNGKLRGQLELPLNSSEEEVVMAATQHDKIKPYIEGNKSIKVIYVPNRLVNLVTS
jgi:leucyl-tRNA synthetase